MKILYYNIIYVYVETMDINLTELYTVYRSIYTVVRIDGYLRIYFQFLVLYVYQCCLFSYICINGTVSHSSTSFKMISSKVNGFVVDVIVRLFALISTHPSFVTAGFSFLCNIACRQTQCF